MRLVCAVVVVLALTAVPAQAAVTTSVAPDAVNVKAGKHATVHVLVANDNTTPIDQVQLRMLTAGAAGITATPRDSAPRTVGAGDATRFIVDVKTKQVLHGDRTVTLLVRYRKNGRPGRAGVALKVGPPVALDPAAVASLTVEGTFASVRSGRTTKAYVRVENATGSDLQVGPVAVTGPDFVEKPQSAETKLPANGTARLDLALPLKDKVTPGKHTLIFDVPVSAGGKVLTTLTAVKEADVSIEGESELLKAFGVPTLLLLPGAMLLGFAALLWNGGVLRHPADDPVAKIDIASIAFIAASIICSFVILSVSALKWTDFFDSYSRGEIFVLAIVSGLTGAGLYLVGMGLRHLWQAWRTPGEGDSHTVVLKKLDRQGLGVTVPTHVQGHRIQPIKARRPQTWFAPRIKVGWTAATDEATHVGIGDARDNEDAKALAERLERAKKHGKATYAWDGGVTEHPFPVASTEVGAETGSEAIVFWDD